MMLFAGEPLELMFQYFVKFGDKPCCITDLKVFLDLIARDQHVQVNTMSHEISQGCLLIIRCYLFLQVAYVCHTLCTSVL